MYLKIEHKEEHTHPKQRTLGDLFLERRVLKEEEKEALEIGDNARAERVELMLLQGYVDEYVIRQIEVLNNIDGTKKRITKIRKSTLALENERVGLKKLCRKSIRRLQQIESEIESHDNELIDLFAHLELRKIDLLEAQGD